MDIALKAWMAGMGAMLFVMGVGPTSHAEDDAYFKLGPLELMVPFKSAAVVYMYDFQGEGKNLVGGETPVTRVWNKVEGTAGVVTSLQGQGAPFVGGNILVGNVLERWVTLPETFKIGGFAGYDFRADDPMYGLKASIKVW